MKFKVRLIDWISGILRVTDYFFEDVDAAKKHAAESKARHSKVYNSKGELVEHIQHIVTENNNTYA